MYPNIPSEQSQLDDLAFAIYDSGYWSWWINEFPDFFLIEFGGTEFYFPPENPDKPPRTRIAIRFIKPESVSYLIKGEVQDFEWVQMLHEDKLEPPSCSFEAFTFTNIESTKSLLELAIDTKTIFGFAPTCDKFTKANYHLVFWCGDMGLAIAAKEITLLNYTGEITFDEIKDANDKWWDYWKDYWDKKDTDHALPLDYVCEIIIPLEKWRYKKE